MEIHALAQVLVETGCVQRERMDEIVARDGATEVLALVSEHESAVAEALAARMQAPVVVLSASTLDLRALRFIPAALMREHQILPVADDGVTLTVAAAAPEPPVIAAIEVATARRIVVVVAIAPLLHRVLEAALCAWATGARWLIGAWAQEQEQTSLALARAPVKVSVPRADSVARALGAAMDAAMAVPGELSAPSTVATLRLRSVPVEPDAAHTPFDGVPVVRLKPRVLIVDDNEDVRALMAEVLTNDGCDVVEAVDGADAVSSLRAQRPDLVILDATLPVMHGFELCASIKRSPAWCKVPVLMVSGVFRGIDSALDIQEVHGADAFLEKPFDLTTLRHVVADLLQRERPPARLSRRDRLTSDRAAVLFDEHMLAGCTNEAAVVLDAWLAADPFCARAWLERGNFALGAGDDLAALRAYELASIYDAKSFIAHLSLAMMYERLGFVRRSRTTWEKAAAAAPDPQTAASIRQQLATS